MRPRDLKLHLRKLYGIESRTGDAVSKPTQAPTFNPDSALDVLDYLQKTKLLVARTVRQLDKMSPKDIEQGTLSYPTMSKKRYSTQKGLPAPPTFWTRMSLKNYLKDITSTQYNAEDRMNDQIGLVSHVVTDLLRPTNRATREYLSVEAYNTGIRYFLGVHDVDAAHLLLESMTGSFLEPDAETFNYFLWPLATNVSADPYNRPKGHPLLMVLSILHLMDKRNIKANTETWNLALQAMPMGFGKSFLVEEMARRKIALNERSLAVCTATIAEKAGSDAAVEWALNNSRTLPSGVLGLLLSLQLKSKTENDQNVARAFELLDTACKKYSTKPNVHTMNTFLASFGARRHLDWQLGTLVFFREQYNIKPSPLSVQYLLEAAMGQKEMQEKYTAIGMILGRYITMPTTPRTRALIRRAMRRAGQKYTLTDPGKRQFMSICNEAKPVNHCPVKIDVLSLLEGRAGSPLSIPPVLSLPRTDSEQFNKKLETEMNWNYQQFTNYVNRRTEPTGV